MPRTSAPVVFICIAVVVFAAWLPGLCGFDWAILSPQWVHLQDCSVEFLGPATACGGEQSLALLSLPPSRAPPVG